MKPEIENQAQNEVGDFLNKYVVTPIDSHVESVLQKSEKSLGSTMGTQTQEMKKDLTAQIAGLRGGLKNTIDEISEKVGTDILNHVADSEKAILEDFESLKRDLDKKLDPESLSRLETGITDAVRSSGEEVRRDLTDLSGTVEQRAQAAEQTICGQISAIQQSLDKKPDIEAFSRLEAKISDTVRNSGEEVQRGLTALSGTVEQRVQIAEQMICEQIGAVQQELHEELDNRIFPQLETDVKAEKRYKVLLTVSLAIGISNLLSFIILAVLISRLF